MSGQVSRGSAGEYQADEQAGVAGSVVEYQADERAGVARLSWRVKSNLFFTEIYLAFLEIFLKKKKKKVEN